jgi:hypothetical protein
VISGIPGMPEHLLLRPGTIPQHGPADWSLDAAQAWFAKELSENPGMRQ